MSGQAEAFPASAGHPDSWNLRPEAVNNSSVCDILEDQTWGRPADDGNHDGGTSSSYILPKTNSAHSESRPEEADVQMQDLKQMQNLPADATAAGADIGLNTKKKRHASTSHPGNHKQVGRKRRKTTDRSATHPKFLMGGTIKDPLNLNSLCNEDVSRLLNAVTPISSPLPHVNKDPNPVIVPVDVRDPLKLNTVSSETDDASNLTRTLTPKSAGKKRKKRLDKLNESHSADEAVILSKPANLNLDGANKPLHHGSASKIPDKIVSPVLPESGQSYRKRKKQEPTAKISRALLVEQTGSRSAEGSPEKKAPPHGKDRVTPEKRKYKRQTSKEPKPQTPKFKDQNKKFQYGNYHRYYGYRNPDPEDDSRLPFLKREWFEGRTCLDIGCNAGHVTLYIAQHLAPERITGIDIDGTLIGIARKNIRNCLEEDKEPKKQKFPVSMENIYGCIASTTRPPVTPVTKFPGNVLFRCANFVPENEDILEMQRPEYDTILCLSVTKWVHLNWGDAGLKRMFHRIFLALRPGGRLILEPQAWPSYMKKKKLTETIYRNFKQIQLKPDKFKDYLLSSRIGFSSCETIGTPLNKSKGFRRPLLMFTKLTTSRASVAKPEAVVAAERVSLSTSQVKDESTKPSSDKVASAHHRTVPSVHSEVCHKHTGHPFAAVDPGTDCTTSVASGSTTFDLQPQPSLSDAQHDEGKDMEVTKSESLHSKKDGSTNLS